MFHMLRCTETVRLEPEDFDCEKTDLIYRLLLEKYPNRVLHGHGFVLNVDGIEQHTTPLVHQSVGSAYCKVVFRLVVFKPIPETIGCGNIRQMDATGLFVTTRFFDPIFIPADQLPDECVFNEERKEWVYKTGNDDLSLSTTADVRFRYRTVDFSPQHDKGLSDLSVVDQSLKDLFSRQPMRVEATIREPGLGLLAWWEEEPDEASETKTDE